MFIFFFFFFFQAEDGIRDRNVTGVQTCALPICSCAATYVRQIAIAASSLRPIRRASTSSFPAAASNRHRLPSLTSGTGNGHASLPTTSDARLALRLTTRQPSEKAAMKTSRFRCPVAGSEDATSASPSGAKIATTSPRSPDSTAAASARTAASADANVRCAGGASAADETTTALAATTVAASARTARMTYVSRCMIPCLIEPGSTQRRRRPPPPERELLRLWFPRELAARSERPLEYPENASDRVPLRSPAALALPLL